LTENVFSSLSGYEISEVIYDGSKSLVYRGVRQSDQLSVIIKLLKRTLPDHNELLSFRHQYSLLKDIHLAGIVSPLALESWQEKLALIMPDNQSVDLKIYGNGQPLEINDFLDIASKIALILEQLHQHNITHKDIKPTNIIIQPESREVALIDFSMASQLNSENQSLITPNALSGTLSYLSPEQTGRMNRELDYRTDFYSLGVTFYELLTGKLPFYSEDAMELVHSHLAREAKPIVQLRADIPPVINNIVHKLMAKNAEDRYQSGKGLLADLQHCEHSYQHKGEIVPFTLGQTDVAQSFHLSEKLYGRFNEIKSLINTFERVCDGQMEAVLISGLSGIGKTALINEVHKPMTCSRGYFIKGKFDQFKRDTPFSALRQALRHLIIQLLGETEEQKHHWQTQIQHALGQQGQLLVEMVPELELLVGEQAAVEELQGAAATHRFHRLMQQFFQIFTTTEHPLVLFLDDLQWIDSATLQLLNVLLDCQPDPQWDRAHQSLLFIGAYRDNETPAEHPLHHTLDKLRHNNLPINSLSLSPLTENDINQLLMDACRCDTDYAQALTQLVYEKTRGNPFFIHQFLQQADDEKLLEYDFNLEHWRYTLAPIQQLAASADVLDFVSARLHRLETEVLNIVTLASCFGHQFDLLTLSQIANISPYQCAGYCIQAIQDNLFQPLGDDYKLALDQNLELESLQIHYRFSHDRIQQAAHLLIPDDQKAQIHLNIGRLLQQQKNPADPVAWLFNVVNQLNAGKQLISDPNEWIALAQLNYQAGQTARRATAYKSARQYIKNGYESLQQHSLAGNSWKNHYSLTLDLHEEALEVAFLLGDYAEQHRWANELLHHAHDQLDCIRTHQLHCLSLIAQDKPLAAVEYALPILKQLGIEFPEQPGAEDFQAELLKTQALLGDRDIASLLNLPLMSDPTILAGIRLLEKLNVALYIATPALFPLAIFKQIQLAIKYGNAPEIVPFYAAYGFILSGVVNEIDSGYEFSLLSLSLLEKLQAQAQKPVTYVNAYAAQFYKNPIHSVIKPLQEASHAGLESGDLHYAAVSLLWSNVCGFFSGTDLPELNQDISRDIKLMTGIHQQVSQVYTNILHQVVLNLSGNNRLPAQLQGKAYQIETSLPQHQQANDRFAVCVAQICQAILAYLFYDTRRANQAIQVAKEYQDAILGTLFSPELVFYDALIELGHYSDTEQSNADDLAEKLSTHQQILSLLASHAPMNFQHKWALVEAERCRLNGDILAAEDFYDAAIEGAEQHKFVHEEALACELATRFYLQRNKIVIARAYMSRAYYLWAHWGAKAKTEQLEIQYPQLLDQLSPFEFEPGSSFAASSSSMETSVGMDLDSIIKFAHSLSGELSLSGVLDKLLNIVMENAGAQRSLLLLKKEPGDSDDRLHTHLSHWQIAGECRMDNHSRQILHNAALSGYHEIPKSLLQSVIKNHQTISIDDARDPYQLFYDDPYFIQNRDQRSVLCQPVLSKGKLIGLLYLENKLTSHIFHQNRQQLMHMLATQAAISIENAQLYENLEEKVVQRTRELNIAQQKLLQQARESGMSEIAIGVIHNIGNVLTPLKASTDLTYQAVTNSAMVEQIPLLMDFISKTMDSDSSTEKKKAQNILGKLPTLISDEFKKLTEQLAGAIHQIQRIEEFIHLQSQYTQVKPMNELIDINALLKDIIKMQNDLLSRERIQCTLELQPVPEISAEKHQLLQILMNLIKNACEAMENIPIEHRKLDISTMLISEDTQDSDQKLAFIQVHIQDQGVGLISEDKICIFSPGYSQKEQLSSFGLHESANYLIARKGNIEVLSEGKGKGALFRVKLPVSPDEKSRFRS